MTDGLLNFESLWQTVRQFALTSGIRLIGAVLLVTVGFILISKLTKLLQKGKGFSKIDANAKDFILGFLSVALKAVLVFTAMAILGIPMTNVVALLGSCGLAVGLALQGSLSNFAGGLMLLIFKPFRTGDYIETPDISGFVREITILYTHIVTLDNKVIMAPNGSLSNAVIKNYSAKDKLRYDVLVSISYKDDIEKAIQALLEAADSVDKVLDDPAPQVLVSKYADSSVELILRVWMKSEDYWKSTPFDIKKAVKPALDKCGISIPYPQLDVHLDR
ncbi:MAG: mechanosensitive ion channel family protein [Acutalibacteraceae bacterium]